MQHRLYRTFGIVLCALACLFVQGCPDENSITKTITVMVEPQTDRTYKVTELNPVQGVDLGDPPQLSATVVAPGTLQVTVPHVSITSGATRSDSAGKPNYTIKTLQVEEKTRDGWVHFSESFTAKDYATDIGVVILVDNSYSLRDQLDQSRDLALQLSQELLIDEQDNKTLAVAVMPMTVEPGHVITFTTNLSEAARQAQRPRAQRYSSLYAALNEAIALFDAYQRPPRHGTDDHERDFQFEEKFIVVISDGQDNSSGAIRGEDVEADLLKKGIHVFVLAVKGSDAIREDALRRLIGRTETAQESFPNDRYIDLSRLSSNTALDRMTRVKDSIIEMCHDRFNLRYQRSENIPEEPTEIRFILTIEPKG
jgi:hypothetical protein